MKAFTSTTESVILRSEILSKNIKIGVKFMLKSKFLRKVDQDQSVHCQELSGKEIATRFIDELRG